MIRSQTESSRSSSLWDASPGLELAQDRGHPACSLAARRALAARLVLVELGDADAELHHADAVVDADDPGRAHRRAGSRERVEVVADVDLVALEDHGRRAAGDHRLQLPAVGHAAAELLDDRAQRHAVLDLVVAAVGDMAGDRDDARACRVLDAELRVLRAAQLEDRRDRRHRLDVVDDGRRGVEALDGRERRLRARLAALALERLEQRRLLAADVCAGAAVHEDRDVTADVGPVLELLERGDEDLVRPRVLAADVDEHRLRLDAVRGDQAALDEPVRDPREDLVVLEAAGLRLVGVDDEVVRLGDRVGLGDERPLQPGGEEGAATAAQAGRLQLLDHRVGLHRARLGERLVAADRLVLGELRQVALVGICEDELLPTRHRFLQRQRESPRRWPAPARRSRGAGSDGRRTRPLPIRIRPGTRSCAR